MAEQVNPNALGAPAEGFGQTVSFAFDPRGEAPMMRPTNSSPSNGSISGGSGSRMQDPNVAFAPIPKQDPTAALLLKVGNDILTRKMDEQRTVKFVEGMQQAMNGAAITDVVESVPWYARLFGDTPVIEGARAYTASSKVNGAVADAAANMHKIESMSGPEAARHFSGMVNSNLTGDAGTDTVIMKGMTEQLPGLMKAQAKAHYGYGQKKAMTALSGNMTSAADAVQSFGRMLSEDKVNDADMGVMKDMFLESIKPPVGIDEENYTKTLFGNMQTMAARGQFHAIEALRTSGVMQAFTPEQATRLESSYLSAATKHRDNYAAAYVLDIASLKSDASTGVEGVTPKMMSDRIDAMDAKYRRATGSPVGLFSSDQKADMLNGTFGAIKAAHLKAAAYAERAAAAGTTASAKAADAALLESTVTGHIINGEFPALGVMAGVSTDMIDRSFLNVIRDTPAMKEALMNQGWVKGAYVNGVIKEQLQSSLRLSTGSGVPTNEWYKSVADFEQMRGLPDGLAMAGAYYGVHAAGLQRASTMLSGQGIGHPQSGLIFQAVLGGSQATKRDALNEKERTQLMKDVVNLNDSAVVRMFTGATALRQDTLQLVGQVAAESTENWRGTDLTDKEATKMGLTEAIRSGQVEIIGGFGIKNFDGQRNGKAPESLKDLASKGGKYIPSGSADGYFRRFMHEQKGIPTGGNVKLYRKGESAGTSQYSVTWMDDGEVGQYNFTAAEWQSYAQAQTIKDTTHVPVNLKFGPAITYPSGGKNIYSHANAGVVDTIKGLRNSTPQGAKLYPADAERATKQADAAKKNQLN